MSALKHLSRRCRKQLSKLSGKPVPAHSGGKYNAGSNNGFDTVAKMPDGTTVIIEDKQMTNGSMQLAVGAGGNVQLTDEWVISVLSKLDQNSDAYKAIVAAKNNGTLIKVVAGVNKTTGQLIFVPVL